MCDWKVLKTVKQKSGSAVNWHATVVHSSGNSAFVVSDSSHKQNSQQWQNTKWICHAVFGHGVINRCVFCLFDLENFIFHFISVYYSKIFLHDRSVDIIDYMKACNKPNLLSQHKVFTCLELFYFNDNWSCNKTICEAITE